MELVICGLAATGLSCQAYRAQPLDDHSVSEALSVPSDDIIAQRSAGYRSPLLNGERIELRRGITPEQAMILAAILNPSVRAQRARANLSGAQLFAAGILPNPQFDLTIDPPTGGMDLGAVTAYSFGLSYEVSSLLTRNAKVSASRHADASVRLDVAWQEWQLAHAARQAAYDQLALREQLKEARLIDGLLQDNLKLMRQAVDAHQKTLLDLSAAEASAVQAHLVALQLERDTRHQRLALLQAMGFGPEARVDLSSGLSLPERLDLPDEADLLHKLESRRLDLLALRRGYSSQEETVRAAIIAQFPKIVLGVHQARDNTDVQSTGVGLTVDIPLFDRNQGNIAIEKATRQQLFDQYMSRVFDARAAIASARLDIVSINQQIADTQASIPSLKQLVATYKLALDQHNADVLSYYAAINDLAQKRLDLVKLKQQLVQARIALELAGGLEPAPMATRLDAATTEPSS